MTSLQIQIISILIPKHLFVSLALFLQKYKKMKHEIDVDQSSLGVPQQVYLTFAT